MPDLYSTTGLNEVELPENDIPEIASGPVDEKRIKGYDFGDVDGPEFKVRTCLKYKEQFNCSSIISIGDGATDIAMFKHSDYAVFIDWGNKHQGTEREGFPLVHDFEQLFELVRSYLEKS